MNLTPKKNLTGSKSIDADDTEDEADVHVRDEVQMLRGNGRRWCEPQSRESQESETLP